MEVDFCHSNNPCLTLTGKLKFIEIHLNLIKILEQIQKKTTTPCTNCYKNAVNKILCSNTQNT